MVVADVAEDMGPWAWGEEDLHSLGGSDKELKRMMLKMFNEHFNSG